LDPGWKNPLLLPLKGKGIQKPNRPLSLLSLPPGIFRSKNVKELAATTITYYYETGQWH